MIQYTLMHILGIETSCDETAAAVLEVNPPSHKASEGTVKVLSNIVSSQVKLHAKYGGVVPNLAAREHVKNIKHVFNLALKKAQIRDFKKEIDLLAVTRGPGLGPALLVGISFAKTLAWKYKKPLVGVNHLEGHIYSNWLSSSRNSKFKILNPKQTQNPKLKIQNRNLFPILNLIVSGGHTELVLMKNYGKYKLIGETLDDAIGEAFDKVARLLDLGYPGGPIISKIAEKGNPDRYPLPSPMIESKDYNFSYSGLKTAVLYLIRDITKNSPSINSGLCQLSAEQKADIAASFQKAAIAVLIKKTIKAAKEYKAESIFLSGGVSANKHLRLELAKSAEELEINYSQPELEYTGDNAVMIALAGYINYRVIKSPSSPTTSLKLRSSRRLRRATNFSWKLVEMDANLGF